MTSDRRVAAGSDTGLETLAREIDREISALPDRSTASVRRVRREQSRRLRNAAASDMLMLADALVEHHRWVAYELIYHHRAALSALDVDKVERLGRGLDTWGAVDAFGRYISGPAWQRGLISDGVIHRWAAASDRWWRRAALVSTIALNLRSAGGTGDTRRTLAVCERLRSDPDDMVIKALSWALRELVIWDPAAVRDFLDAHDAELAPRVRREVRTKLETGRKHPPRT
jgi:3-methyladenine DNA glycosylase AlkD